ncbi:MAG TPA: LD-carboxypeptidase [Rhizomicrobium sp.]|jgi:muramoyltetrapeptide carboxypeptidase|nr:LD-carboxypeptidase [Rhizomicrobium sp.]
MQKPEKTIGIVAPASRIDENVAKQVKAAARELYGGRVELFFHPQCFLSSGHFAGDDTARSEAFVQVANDERFDAFWWARGGYGANRIAESVLPRLTETARKKLYLGYSDGGFLLAGLYKAGFKVAHGPVVADIRRDGGEAAVLRALKFLVERDAATLEPTVLTGKPVAALNLTILSHIIGSPLEPDFTGHILMLEDVSEPMYAIDRALFHITSSPNIRKVAGLKLGRCTEIPPNDPDFCQTEEQVMRHWCDVSGIPYLGRADIGHDSENKVVPFGVWRG